MLELFPEGFEEVESSDGVELIAYHRSRLGRNGCGRPFGGARGQERGRRLGATAGRPFTTPFRVGRLWIGAAVARAAGRCNRNR